MAAAFLWVNAVLYGVFAAWCALRWAPTSRAIGFVELSGSGRSEYLAVYGGLQLGLALWFGWLALHPEQHRSGILFGLLLYGAIVPFRWIGVATLGPVERATLMLGVLETAFLAWALLAWFAGRASA